MAKLSDALVRLRGAFILELGFGVVATLFLLTHALVLDAESRIAYCAVALCFGVATLGLWQVKDWARLMLGLLAAISALYIAAATVLAWALGSEATLVVWIVTAILLGHFSFRLLRPETKRRFSAARAGRHPAKPDDRFTTWIDPL